MGSKVPYLGEEKRENLFHECETVWGGGGGEVCYNKTNIQIQQIAVQIQQLRLQQAAALPETVVCSSRYFESSSAMQIQDNKWQGKRKEMLNTVKDQQ